MSSKLVWGVFLFCWFISAATLWVGMTALRLKEVAVSCDQARSLLCLSVLPPAVHRSKPCIPPALGPRPSETPCTPPPNLHPDNPHKMADWNRSAHLRFSGLHFSIRKFQPTNGGGLSVLPQHQPRFGPSVPSTCNSDGYEDGHSMLLTQFTREMRIDQQPPSSSLDLIKRLYSLDESWWLSSEAVVVQQAARLEQPQKPQHQLQRQQQGSTERQVPSNKATPAQVSFVLLKLREEVSNHCLTLLWSPVWLPHLSFPLHNTLKKY